MPVSLVSTLYKALRLNVVCIGSDKINFIKLISKLCDLCLDVFIIKSKLEVKFNIFFI